MNNICNKKIKLNDGNEIYLMGIGTHKIDDLNLINDLVLSGMGIGYKRIDCSNYFRQERMIGQAIVRTFYERKDIYISTIISPIKTQLITVESEVNRILHNFNINYIDLLVISSNDKYWFETYKYLLEEQKKGKVRSIGVKNFPLSDLKIIYEKFNVHPAIVQIKMTPGSYKGEYVEYCKKNNISINALGLMNNGLVYRVPTITEVAKKYKLNNFQTVICWAIQRKLVINPKVSESIRMLDNIAIRGIEFSESDLKKMDVIVK